MNKKLVVITGASSGFGAALAKEFSKSGYPLLLLARRLDQMKALGLPNTLCKKVDVTNFTEFENAIREAEAIYGKTDLLINNAGIMLLGDLEVQDPREWKKMLDVNIMGVMNGMQIVMSDMKEREWGTIINVSSMAGVMPFGNHAAYCASKYGVRGLTQTARMELSPYNIRVIVAEPGAVSTELLEHTTDQRIINNYYKWKEEVGVIDITAEDIAKTIKFVYEMPQSVLIREFIISDTRQDS
ncbi:MULTISPECIES: SDR family oxidoreductase [Elizabethkingia]|uniref:Oxidoreductase n=1 Tax=Elizabethkingia ursingii TaxID=1756150 RepID=A0AAJ3NEH4_9FLAO|nr:MULTISPECIES: SDR family oxidoreductase [Elizabethkingia]AQW92900.1 oxidoreductase [Elizabethkingia anophelis]AQX09810.1 oxidoreductase [Elizabethkingia ursingii]OPB60819.1 oxidoreductase [Elizabethkingia anophelis]OPB78937.1 oxidoreductase [Elizabethkingia ursingii]OPB91631.1 oxidoreductase [Elizabethkingia ursingii]